MSDEILLEVKDLTIGFPRKDAKWSRAVDRFSLRLRAGERIGIVGESGSGKSLTALACLGIVPAPGRVLKGEVFVNSCSVLQTSEAHLARVRGGEIGLVLQEAADALNPVYTVGFQIEETIAVHSDGGGGNPHHMALELLEKVAIEDPLTVVRAYPHELSGGLAQRVMLALALAGRPKILIADEPTSSLDLVTQKKIIEQLHRLCTDEDLALVLISHDLLVVEEVVDRVAVMYRGSIVEEAPRDILFSDPRHPYTRLLLASAPGRSLRENSTQAWVASGSSDATASGCLFHPRCPLAEPSCHLTAPELIEIKDRHRVRCPILNPGQGEIDGDC